MDNSRTAELIKSTCKQKGISISTLLTACGIRKSLIYDLEKRNYAPSAITIGKIADYLGVSVDYLLGRDAEAAENEDAAVAMFSQLKPEYQDVVLNQVRQLLELQKTEQDKK